MLYIKYKTIILSNMIFIFLSFVLLLALTTISLILILGHKKITVSTKLWVIGSLIFWSTVGLFAVFYLSGNSISDIDFTQINPKVEKTTPITPSTPEEINFV